MNKRDIAGAIAMPSKNPLLRSVAANAVKLRSMSARTTSTAATPVQAAVSPFSWRESPIRASSVG